MSLPSLSNPTGRSAPEFAYDSISHHPRASTRTRRPTLHGDNTSRRPSSGIEAENLGWRAPDVLGALPLEQSLARELEREPPLTLPKPWSYEDTSNHHVPFPLAGRRSLRASSRSPEQRRPSLSAHPTLASMHQQQIPSMSIPPPPMPEQPKAKFVEGLVGAAVVAVEVVWKQDHPPKSSVTYVNGLPTPTVSPTYGSPPEHSNVLPLRQFIKEVLRRSRSTCSTLQTALYYIHKSRDAIRDRVKAADDAKVELARMWENGPNGHYASAFPSPPFDSDDRAASSRVAAALVARTRDPIVCGRRMFLAALICASKFLQDRTYSNRAWAKISSLPVQEINANEKVFLELLDYNLFVNADLFQNCKLLICSHLYSVSYSTAYTDNPFFPSGTRRLQELAEKQDRRVQTPLSGPLYDTMSLPKPSLPLPSRDGIIRSQSDYLPAPEATEVLRGGMPSYSAIHLPPTPITPRGMSLSPDRFGSTPIMPSGLGSLHRSHTDTRLDTLAGSRKLPSLGSLSVSGNSHRLPLPTLSLKIPSYLPASPSPLSAGGRYNLPTSALDEDTFSPLDKIPRPSLNKRYTSAIRDLSLDSLPRPSLSRMPSQSCGSSLSRLLNGHHAEHPDWQTDDRMIS